MAVCPLLAEGGRSVNPGVGETEAADAERHRRRSYPQQEDEEPLFRASWTGGQGTSA